MITRQKTRTEQARSIANFLPGGPLFGTKTITGTNLYNFLYGLAKELFLADGYIREFNKEILPDETVQFISEWEDAVGIPDDCFYVDTDINQRRANVLTKLAALGLQTAAEMEALGVVFGATITVESVFESSAFPLELPFSLYSETEARFTILVTFIGATPDEFPLTFPVSFGDPSINILGCLLAKMKPANCDIVFREA